MCEYLDRTPKESRKIAIAYLLLGSDVLADGGGGGGGGASVIV